MANAEQLAILKQGVEAWNKWRTGNRDMRPNLSMADLRGAHLDGANLSEADLGAADLSEADLFQANLIKADLSGADLFHAILGGARLSVADLRGAKLSGAHLSLANLSGANLTDADLSGATLTDADLRGANLNRANLTYADLVGANLVAADLSRAHLNRANLDGAHLSGADLNQTYLGSTIFGNVDLSKVKGLDTANHVGPSTVGIDTVFKSGGKIPVVFLRGAGVPDNFIIYMHSLVGQPIQHSSCFISFTQADDTFAERLYNDLQVAGVRCWRWREDAKWGRTLMRSIDESVRVYDKLIVICSENSLNVPPVLREIERALQKEDEAAKDGREPEVLFPIRLDDYIYSSWDYYRKADVVAKNVGDFRNWNDPNQYRKSFDRLVRDLKA